jgi:hypothetical protein
MASAAGSGSGSAAAAPPPEPPFTLAEGVARVVEKHISTTFSRRKDDIAVVPLHHPSLPEDPPALSAMPPEVAESLRTAVQRETNRAALRTVYKQRMAAFKETLAELDPKVSDALRAMNRAELTITAPNVQITLKQKAAAQEGGGGAGAEGGGEEVGAPSGAKELDRNASSSSSSAAAAPIARSKPQLRQGMVYATASAIADLGVDPAAEYDPHLAERVLSHPQLRPLILVKLPEAMDQSAREYAEALQEGRIAKRGRKPSAARPASIKAQIRGEAGV